MSEVKKIATRASYGNALVELGKKHDDLVVLDADLAAATQTGIFKKAFPERHIDCGIAECNMMGIAAGIATTGKVPFASTFAMFAAGRAFEQVRNSVGYPKLNVKIGATHGGISVGEDGATHQCCEDFALMRTIPGMVVACPSDDIEAKAMVEAAYEHVGPVYMRFGRLAVPVINDNPDYKFELGKGIVLREGKDLTIIANGLCVAPSLEAAAKLAEDVKAGKVEAEDITEPVFASYLDTADIPDPDLLIRTCNEQRISNFLLWQLAYTEFYFTPVPWPDFTKEELIKAVEAYNHRDRRYGGLKEE